MPNNVYEIRNINNPLLPFVYRPDAVLIQREGPPNWHKEIELLYCVSGEGYIKCGLDICDFVCGDIFVVNADTPHAVGTQSSVTYRCLIIDNSFCASNGIPISALYFQKLIRDDALNTLFDSVTSAYTHYNDNTICAVADIRYAVLGLLRKLCTDYVVSETESAQSKSSTYVRDALDYIRRNLSGTITLDHIASYVGISKFHLAREFKAFTGRTVIDTVNLIRCTEAKRLIKGGMHVSAAARFCGFENLSYFSRTFKKLFQVLPSTLMDQSK